MQTYQYLKLAAKILFLSLSLPPSLSLSLSTSVSLSVYLSQTPHRRYNTHHAHKSVADGVVADQSAQEICCLYIEVVFVIWTLCKIWF